MKWPSAWLILPALLPSTPVAGSDGRFALACDRDEVIAGERVLIRGGQLHELQIPTNAKPGQRIWIEREGAWIDFTVVPLAEMTMSLEDDVLQVRLASNAARSDEFAVRAHDQTNLIRLEPRQPRIVTFPLPPPRRESAGVLLVEVRHGEMGQRLERGLRAVQQVTTLAPWPETFTKGMRLRGHGETSDLGQTATIVEARRTRSGGVEQAGLFMHPPWQGGVGYCLARYDDLALPAQPAAAFRALVGKGDGSDLGDGIDYWVAVVEATGQETLVADQAVSRHEWKAITADLSRWAGQHIALKLVTDVGPNNNSSGDWGCWGDLRLESLRPQLHHVLVENADTCRHVPGPHPVANVTQRTLREARAGWLRYDGKGLSGTGQYATFGALNGVELGTLAPAGGHEAKGVFAEAVRLPLTPDAIQSLRLRNRFTVRNPNQDSFSVRRCWIELELADGRNCTSDIATATYTQPPTWAHAEGIGVPFDREIEVEIWFPIVP